MIWTVSPDVVVDVRENRRKQNVCQGNPSLQLEIMRKYAILHKSSFHNAHNRLHTALETVMMTISLSQLLLPHKTTLLQRSLGFYLWLKSYMAQGFIVSFQVVETIKYMSEI